MNKESNTKIIISWILGLILLTIGILNIILVDPLPGIIYILLSLIYFPPIMRFIKKNIGLSISFTTKLVMWFVIMWPTLGVGDLAEILGL